ncbi:hypothetical protein EJ02DRAFT_193724 [Clathrospora elynae]|uniref:Uncharacterized protein n=1 Tax=Clathrospora elynae TaxID=706981 RepID=A0A6A5SPN0_9PLEO|nr:hypothetical protein EJ02DRAFT_193724 [Clathrospora elynae]
MAASDTDEPLHDTNSLLYGMKSDFITYGGSSRLSLHFWRLGFLVASGYAVSFLTCMRRKRIASATGVSASTSYLITWSYGLELFLTHIMNKRSIIILPVLQNFSPLTTYDTWLVFWTKIMTERTSNRSVHVSQLLTSPIGLFKESYHRSCT